MNILFIFSFQDSISSTKPLQTQEQIQFGISYISSFLKKHGHFTKLLVLTRGYKDKDIEEYIEQFCPTLICFTSVYTEYGFIVKVARYIKGRYPHIFLIAGGPHVSLNPDDCITDPFDALCIGEGEEAVLALAEKLQNNTEPSGIPNLWIKHGTDVEKNPTRPFLQDLDSLPFPDREMWQEWIAEPLSRCSVLLGRGCPYRCTYCCNHALKKLASGAYVRFRSPDNILAEIMELSKRFPAQKEIYLEVETFGVKVNWAIELCSKLEGYNAELSEPLSYGVNMRITPNANHEDLFSALKKANFRFINIGLESGSNRLRSEVLKRHYSNEDIIKAVTLARKYGMQVFFYNLIGITGETLTDFEETIEINRICQPDSHMLSIFFPYPGTDLYFLCKEQGLLKESLDTEMERSKAALDLPGFSRGQIQKSYIWFDYHVYKGRRPLYKILVRVIFSKIRSSYYLNNLYRKLTNYTLFNWFKDRIKSLTPR